MQICSWRIWHKLWGVMSKTRFRLIFVICWFMQRWIGCLFAWKGKLRETVIFWGFYLLRKWIRIFLFKLRYFLKDARIWGTFRKHFFTNQTRIAIWFLKQLLFKFLEVIWVFILIRRPRVHLPKGSGCLLKWRSDILLPLVVRVNVLHGK